MYYPNIPYYYLIIKNGSTWRYRPKQYIYLHSFEDVRIYLNKQLFNVYKTNSKYYKSQEEKINLVKYTIDTHKIYESTTEGLVQIPIIRDWTINEMYTTLSNKENLYTPHCTGETKAYYPLKELQQITAPNYKLPKYSYPIRTISVIRKDTYQGRKHFSYSVVPENDWWSQLTSRTRAANTNPELQSYLRPRDRQIYTNYKHDQIHNQHNIGNNWKRHTHNRKQWAKRMDNPSYTKLSKEMWKYELGQENLS